MRALNLRTWWTGEDSNPRSSQGAAGLQPAAIDRSATCPKLFPTTPELGAFLSAAGPYRLKTNRRIVSVEVVQLSSPSGCNTLIIDLFPRIRHCFRRLALPARAPNSQSQHGAGEGIRTPDPLITNQMLYQLSYASGHKPPIIGIRSQNCNRLKKQSPKPLLGALRDLLHFTCLRAPNANRRIGRS